MKPICDVPDDPREARAVLVALAQHGIRVHTSEPSFLGPGRYWVDDERYADARQLMERVASSAASRRARRQAATDTPVRPRWRDGAAWVAGLAILLMLLLFLGLPILAALGW